MSEEIKAVLTADSSALTAELQKAAASVAAFDSKVKATGKANLPVMELSPAYLQAMEGAAARTGELRRQTLLAGQSGRMGAMGFLAFSQAVEDAQYGIRGVLNNIPQMVLGFGGGMGLAGAISLAAVAAVTLLPHIRNLYGTMDSGTLDKAAGEWERIQAEGNKAAEAIATAAAAELRVAELAERTNEAYRERVTFSGQMAGYYDRQLAAGQAARASALDILAARQGMAESLGGDVKPFIVARQNLEFQGTESDLSNRQKELESATAEAARMGAVRSNLSAENKSREAAATKELVELTRSLASAEANAARAEALRAGSKGDEQRQYADAKAASLATAAKLKERIDLRKEELRAAREGGDAALKEAQSALAAADSKINRTYQEIQALEELKKKREELFKIERQQAAIAETKTALSTAEKQQPKLEKALETAKRQEDAVTANVDELNVLRETLKEGKKKGDQLRDELALKKQARDLARDSGLDEDTATALIKERGELEKNIAAIPTGSIRERRMARSEERDRLRDEMRNEKVAEAQRKREARGQDGKPVDFMKGRQDLERIQRAAAEERAKAQDDLNKNVARQTELQEKIEKSISAITAA